MTPTFRTGQTMHYRPAPGTLAHIYCRLLQSIPRGKAEVNDLCEATGPPPEYATVNVRRFATGKRVVHVTGDLRGDTGTLRRVAAEAITRSAALVALDLSEATGIDRSGLKALVAARGAGWHLGHLTLPGGGAYRPGGNRPGGGRIERSSSRSSRQSTNASSRRRHMAPVRDRAANPKFPLVGWRVWALTWGFARPGWGSTRR
jgi:hypothetical protein